jgi:transposase InsO family protein
LTLKAGKHADAAHVTHTLYHEVILRKGVPLLFHTDAAKAFIGTAMEALASTLGIKQTNTLAHNPKSNAKMERVWEFVGRALKSMTAEKYEQFHLHLPFLAQVWNNAPDSDTGVTPFEAEHGMPMRSIAESLTQNPPTEGLPADTNDLHTIAQSCEGYAQVLANIKAVEKVTAARNLNAKGHAKITYKVGDRVTFFLPPSQKQAQTLGKNPKHMLQYAGPGRITRSLSDKGTSWEISWNGRRYQRNVMHMHHYRPDQHVLYEQRAVHDNNVMVGSFVAVLDTAGDPNYHVAKVTSITETCTKLHYMGTQSTQLRSCV